MKNSEQPINPVPYLSMDGTVHHDVYFGLNKREYFAVKCMPTADSFFSSGAGCSSGFIMDFLCIPKQIQVDRLLSVERKYDAVSMYPKAVAKMAVIMADELLKQLEQ